MMPSVLFVCLHRPNRSPSQRFRFEQYIEVLEQAGFNTRFSYLLNAKQDRIFYQKGHIVGKFLILLRSFWIRIRETYIYPPADIVFVQRECFMLGTSFFEKRFSKRSKLIFDFDDSIWMQNVSAANKRFSFLKDAGKTAKIIQYSTMVFAGNPFLADYAKSFNSNVKIVPTTIDTEMYQPVNVNSIEPIRVGWSGSFTTIQHFETAIPVLKRIKTKYKQRVRFVVIGDAHYRNEKLGIQGIAWKAETEVDDLQQIDIGVMPLPDDEWAKGKCGLKGLQYMALGIPTIMSPVGVNCDIIKDGENGFLASSQEEWLDKLSALIESSELRAKLGSNGRKTVEEKYSVKANAALYVKLFTQVLVES